MNGYGIQNIQKFATIAKTTPGAIFMELLDALAFGETLDVLFDARRAECRVPDSIRGEGQMLKYSLRFSNPPIADLVANDEGVSATLSIGGVLTPTFVPWSVVGLIIVPQKAGEIVIAKLAGSSAPRLRLLTADEPLPEGAAEEFVKTPAVGGLRLIRGGGA